MTLRRLLQVLPAIYVAMLVWYGIAVFTVYGSRPGLPLITLTNASIIIPGLFQEPVLRAFFRNPTTKQRSAFQRIQTMLFWVSSVLMAVSLTYISFAVAAPIFPR